jgi:hypothetical protein
LGKGFQTKVLENIVQDTLGDFKDELCEQIRNLHLEVLRQNELQKVNIPTQDYLNTFTSHFLKPPFLSKKMLTKLY